MTTLVFGHKSPDTDSTGSPIIWAWYLNDVQGIPAAPALLGEPNTEALFMLERWNLDKPQIIEGVAADAPVVIVDTNNPAELPADINAADIRAYTIGFGRPTDVDHPLLAELASQTSGSFYDATVPGFEAGTCGYTFASDGPVTA